MIITGIGSRKTPKGICKEMTKIGQWAWHDGHHVRSGHADGADYAFELGARSHCIVYLPFPGFNSKLPILGTFRILDPGNKKARRIVEEIHPNPKKLSAFGMKCMMRNVHQILGDNHDNLSKVVVCWTPGGKYVGGTSFAMRLADRYGITIINMAKYPTADEVIAKLVGVNQNEVAQK